MAQRLDILLVGDNEGDVDMTQNALQDDSRCRLSVAHDGVEALDFMNKRGAHAQAPSPRLIFLDVNMPRMNGKQVLRALKEDTTFKLIPVVMFTSSQSTADIRECYELQASSYIVKPFDGKEFAHTVRALANFWLTLGQLP